MNVQMLNLIIERCALTLEHNVAPHINDSFAAAQVRSVVQLLQSLAPTLELSNRVLKEENEAMHIVLEAVVPNLSSAAQGTTFEHDERFLTIVSGVQPDKAFDVPQLNAHLKSCLVVAINLLHDLEVASPSSDLKGTRVQIRSMLRQQLNNELAHLTLPA
jgi:hypothetical protein